MFPLLQFTIEKCTGRFVNGRFLLVAGWTSCLFITVMDIISLPQVLGQAWAVIAGLRHPVRCLSSPVFREFLPFPVRDDMIWQRRPQFFFRMAGK